MANLFSDEYVIQGLFCWLNEADEYRLIVEQSVVCFGHDHMPVFIYSFIIALVLLVLYPGALSIFIARDRRLARHDHKRHKRKLGLLHSHFKARFEISHGHA